MKELTWRPQGGAEPQVSHRALKAQFGDGYTQRAGDGINTRKEVWPLTFIGSKAEIESNIIKNCLGQTPAAPAG